MFNVEMFFYRKVSFNSQTKLVFLSFHLVTLNMYKGVDIFTPLNSSFHDKTDN